MDTYLCFDVGGTSIKYGVIDERGHVLEKEQFKTPAERCRETIPAAIIALYNELKNNYILAGIGISTAGQVELDGSGVRYAIETIKDYYPTKFREILEQETGLPTAVENDVNAAALGEYWQGAAKGQDQFLCLTIGTGIGGAVFANGKLQKGVFGAAGEFGHITIKYGDRPCVCGQSGCLETYASHSALLRDYREQSGMDISGKAFFDLVRAGDPEAMHVFSHFTDHLAVGLASLVHTLDPGLIVIGGGISKEGVFLAEAIEEALRKHAMPSYMDHTHVVTASLENDAGILGACYAVRQYGREMA